RIAHFVPNFNPSASQGAPKTKKAVNAALFQVRSPTASEFIANAEPAAAFKPQRQAAGFTPKAAPRTDRTRKSEYPPSVH
ncbi:MAG: hypothetical protein POH28_16635, partial [Acidocella sp.]|nr:hypothetical protein [Acidocella sp.]